MLSPFGKTTTRRNATDAIGIDACAHNVKEYILTLRPSRECGAHRTVQCTSDEYARYEADKVVHTNIIENVFSVFKRGLLGTDQHCGENPLAPLPVGI